MPCLQHLPVPTDCLPSYHRTPVLVPGTILRQHRISTMSTWSTSVSHTVQRFSDRCKHALTSKPPREYSCMRPADARPHAHPAQRAGKEEPAPAHAGLS